MRLPTEQRRRRRLAGLVRLAVIVALFVWSGAACGGKHVRGSEDPNLDEMTLSLRLDRTDLERLYEEDLEKLMKSSVMKQWKKQATDGEAPVVAVFPIRNETSEHIRGSLDALLSKLQTDLVNRSPVDVVSHDNQEQLIAEVKRQQSAAFDPKRLAEYGKQLGAQYYVTGKAYDVAERVEGARRVQYFLFIQVLDVETGAIKFQTEANVTKGLIS